MDTDSALNLLALHARLEASIQNAEMMIQHQQQQIEQLTAQVAELTADNKESV